MNDMSDDEITQCLSIACARFSQRFGKPELIAALTDLIETLEQDSVEVIPQSRGCG